MIRNIFCLLLALSGFEAIGADFPQGYFSNPLDIPILLAGNFGECRPNHFHTGIDIKTNGRENLPVHAAAKGYISRIAVSHAGYGNVLYVTHPNGYVTVYAHLNEFVAPVQAYLKEQQYALQRWNVDLDIPAEKFLVQKGDLIALSGNTGGSTAPHLHFEIRDAKTEHVLNAMLFGLPIKDKRAPVIQTLAFYDAGKSIYEQNPILVQVTNKKGKISVPPVNLPFNKVRVGLMVNDYMDGSTNTLGLYKTELRMDDKLQASTILEQLDFAENRYVNGFADYKLKEEKGKWFTGLYRLPGNRLAVYSFLNDHNGIIDISDEGQHALEIKAIDAAGNESVLQFTIAGKPGKEYTPCPTLIPQEGAEMQERSAHITLDNKQLYDAICFKYQETSSPKYWSNIIQLHDSKVPLHHFTQLSIALNKPVPFQLRTKLVFVHHIKAANLPGNNPQSGVAATYENGRATAAVRTFGNYYVVVDTVAPVIKPLQKETALATAKNLRFTISDQLTSVSSMSAELDGKWLCFSPKNNQYTYVFDEHCRPGKHQLVVTAEDESGNKSVYNYTFTR